MRRPAGEDLFLPGLDLSFILPAELVMTQAVPRKGRVHYHQVGRFRNRNLIAGINLRHQLRRIRPGHYVRLLVAEKLQRAQVGFAAVVNAQQHPPDFHIAELRGRRQQTQRCRRHVGSGQVHIVAGEHLLNQGAGGIGVHLGLRCQLANALGGGHQQSAGAAGRIGNPQFRNGIRVCPVAQVIGNRQCRQQGSRRRSGVKRAVVARRVQHSMKNAPQQVMPIAGSVAGRRQRRLGSNPQGVAKRRVRRYGQKRRPARLKDGLVVQRQYQIPGIAEPSDGVTGFQAKMRHQRRPGAGERLRRAAPRVHIGGHPFQMAVQSGMEHHGGSRHQ